MIPWLPIEGWRDVLDITLVAGMGWLVIRYLRSARSRTAVVGLGLLAVVYFLARVLELRLSEALFQTFFAGVVLVLVIVFQDDLRRAFEQLASWRRGRAPTPPGMETQDLLVRSVARLASTRTGALIVIPGREPLDRHIEGGVPMGGRVSEPLLLSLFDASSPGHDGAVVLRGSKVERFAVHLPLSANHEALGHRGTRHAAALGLTERCDATCIVVSEERGSVSIARGGELRVLPRPEDLAAELGARFAESAEGRPWWRGRAGLDAVVAAAAALALWVVFVPGSAPSEVVLQAPIEIVNLPPDLALESVEPEAVEVRLRGLRRDLLLAERAEVRVRVDGYLARLGRRTFAISPQDVRTPDGVSALTVEPERVRISLAPVPAPAKPGADG